MRPLPTGSFLEERAPLEKNERFPRSTSCIVIVATNVSFADGANSRVTGELGIEIELKMTRLATRLAESCRRKTKRGFLRHGNDTSKYFFSLKLVSRIKLHIVLDIMVAVFKETIERDLSRIRNTELHKHVSEMRIFNV